MARGLEQSQTEARVVSGKTSVTAQKREQTPLLWETTNPGGDSAQWEIRLKREGRGFEK